MSATRTTTSPISMAGSTRTAVGETPSRATDAADSSGVKRRLVDVPERRVLARDDEVHLVAVEAVAPATASSPTTMRPATRSTGQGIASTPSRPMIGVIRCCPGRSHDRSILRVDVPAQGLRRTIPARRMRLPPGSKIATARRVGALFASALG